jgi:hypothetical protein
VLSNSWSANQSSELERVLAYIRLPDSIQPAQSSNDSFGGKQKFLLKHVQSNKYLVCLSADGLKPLVDCFLHYDGWKINSTTFGFIHSKLVLKPSRLVSIL